MKLVHKNKRLFRNNRKALRLSWIILLVFVFLCKVLFLESGIFASAIYLQSQICECNHSSKKEMHSTTVVTHNEKLFQSALIPFQFTKNKKLPNCHTVKNKEIHICSCSKKKGSSNLLHSQLMNPNFIGFYSLLLSPTIESSICNSCENTHLIKGHPHILDKPPRLQFCLL